MGVWDTFSRLDAYPKVNEDFFQRSISGGIITIVSSIIMLCLFISELSKLSRKPPYLYRIVISIHIRQRWCQCVTLHAYEL